MRARPAAQICGLLACGGATCWAVVTPSSELGGVESATLLTLMLSVGAYVFAYELWLRRKR